MNKKSSISAELTANTGKFRAGLEVAKNDANKLVKDLNGMKATGFLSGMKEKIGTGAANVKAAGEMAIGVGEIIKGAMESGGAMRNMIRQLESVTDSSNEAMKALGFLEEVASRNELELQPLVSAYEHMRSLSMSATDAETVITEVGNALALAGKGSDSLGAIAETLAMVKEKGFAEGGELENIRKLIPALREVYALQLGATGSKQMENMKITAKEFFDVTVRGLQSLQTADSSAARGAMVLAPRMKEEASKKALQATGVEFQDVSLKPRVKAEQDLEAASKRRLRIQEDNNAAAEKESEEKIKLIELEGELNYAKEQVASGYEDYQTKVDALEDEVSLLKEAKDFAKQKNISEELAVKLILAQNDARRKGEQAIRDSQAMDKSITKGDEAQKSSFSEAEQIQINEARAKGKNKKADKLERAAGIRQKTESLIASGVGGEEAKQLAERGQKAEENAAFRERTGRSKISGAKSANLLTREIGDTGKRGGFHAESSLAEKDGPEQKGLKGAEKILAEIRDAIRENADSPAAKARK